MFPSRLTLEPRPTFHLVANLATPSLTIPFKKNLLATFQPIPFNPSPSLIPSTTPCPHSSKAKPTHHHSKPITTSKTCTIPPTTTSKTQIQRIYLGSTYEGIILSYLK